MLVRRIVKAFDGEAPSRLDVPLATRTLSPGVYLVRVASGEGVRTQRLVVAR